MEVLQVRKSERILNKATTCRFVFLSDGGIAAVEDLHAFVPDEEKHFEGSVVTISYRGTQEKVRISRINASRSEREDSDMTSDDNEMTPNKVQNPTRKVQENKGPTRVKKAKTNLDPYNLTDMNDIFSNVESSSNGGLQKTNSIHKKTKMSRKDMVPPSNRPPIAQNRANTTMSKYSKSGTQTVTKTVCPPPSTSQNTSHPILSRMGPKPISKTVQPSHSTVRKALPIEQTLYMKAHSSRNSNVPQTISKTAQVLSKNNVGTLPDRQQNTDVQVLQSKTANLRMPESQMNLLPADRSILEPLSPDQQEKDEQYKIWSPLKSLNEEVLSKASSEERFICVRAFADRICPPVESEQVLIHEAVPGVYISAAAREDAIHKSTSTNQLARLMLCAKLGTDFIVKNSGKKLSETATGNAVFRAIAGLCWKIFKEKPYGLGRKRGEKGSFIMLYTQLAAQLRKKTNVTAGQSIDNSRKKNKKSSASHQSKAANLKKASTEDQEVMEFSSHLSAFEGTAVDEGREKSSKIADRNTPIIDDVRSSVSSDTSSQASRPTSDDETRMESVDEEGENEDSSLPETCPETRGARENLDGGNCLNPQDCQIPADTCQIPPKDKSLETRSHILPPNDPVHQITTNVNSTNSGLSSNPSNAAGDKNTLPLSSTQNDAVKSSLSEIGKSLVNSSSYLPPALCHQIGNLLQMLQPMSNYGSSNMATQSPMYQTNYESSYMMTQSPMYPTQASSGAPPENVSTENCEYSSSSYNTSNYADSVQYGQWHYY